MEDDSDQLNKEGNNNNETLHPELEILFENVLAALRKLKKTKSAGADNIVIVMITASKADSVKLLHVICNKIWCSGEWPKDWTTSVYILEHKKGTNTEYSNYKTIATTDLISRVRKEMLNILHKGSKHLYYQNLSLGRLGLYCEGKRGNRF